MRAIEVKTETRINHAELGADVWEWTDEEQAAFLVGFAKAFGAQSGVGLLQIHFIARKLRESPMDLNAVRWLNDHLAEYLADEGAR